VTNINLKFIACSNNEEIKNKSTNISAIKLPGKKRKADAVLVIQYASICYQEIVFIQEIKKENHCQGKKNG